MGYDVHITRAEDWTESKEHSISLDEWIAYVNRDPEMRLDGFAEVRDERSEVIVRTESEGLSVWTGYSGHDPNGNMAWFDFRNGRIVVKNPDEEILRKMSTIATALNARVQGDEGEFYDGDGETIDSPQTMSHSRPPWYARWFKFLRPSG